MSRRRVHRIDVALQGGGAHGAFTWGVLDRLLEDECTEIEAISGASAGAMNAVALAHGLAAGGRRGAREALREFWSRASRAARSSPGPAALFGDWAFDGSPLAWTMDWMTRFDRVNGITFNASLVKELRVVAYAAWPLVQRLHRLGSEAAADWLAGDAAHLGRRSTLKLEAYL